MKLTLFLIIIAIAMFFLPIFFVQDIEAFYTTYAFSWSNMLARPYVLITSIFLHASLLHLLSNIFVWFFFGSAVEKEFGPWKMLLIFFLGAFAGDLLSLAFYPAGTISIGASAGIFALIGTGMLVKPLDLSFYPLVIPVPLIFLGMLYAFYNAYAFATNIDPSISYIGHFGGLAVGLVFGFKKTGLKQGLKTIIITLAIMILIPLLFLLLR